MENWIDKFERLYEKYWMLFEYNPWFSEKELYELENEFKKELNDDNDKDS